MSYFKLPQAGQSAEFTVVSRDGTRDGQWGPQTIYTIDNGQQMKYTPKAGSQADQFLQSHVGKKVRVTVTMNGDRRNYQWEEVGEGAPSSTHTANPSSGLDLRQKLIVRQNALTNAVAILQGTDPSVRAVLEVARQFYRWVIADEMPTDTAQFGPPVNGPDDDVPF